MISAFTTGHLRLNKTDIDYNIQPEYKDPFSFCVSFSNRDHDKQTNGSRLLESIL